MSQEWVVGLHAVIGLLNNTNTEISKLYLQKGRKDKRFLQLLELAKKRNVPVDYLDKVELDKKSSDNHQGVMALIKHLKNYNEGDLLTLIKEKQTALFILVLDTITDPHNLGACLRSADAAGVDVVIAPKDKSVGLTTSARKVACGAAESIPFIQVTNLARTIEQLKSLGIWVYGACGEAEKSLYQIEFNGSTALVFGAEGKGLRRLTREVCDDLFSIPMFGSVTSLNVSVATGISLYEVVRQRLSRPL